ncbi:hypothetical protein EDD21DRAFT_158030 [Dissophora ornata]|nr:hypothetical protein EDD21DRAFT_158030 [Dissophora ornata]
MRECNCVLWNVRSLGGHEGHDIHIRSHAHSRVRANESSSRATAVRVVHRCLSQRGHGFGVVTIQPHPTHWHLCGFHGPDMLNPERELEIPAAVYGCAQTLAGCILVNTGDGQAAMVNTVEAYGRTPMVDDHCDSFRVKKGVGSDLSA